MEVKLGLRDPENVSLYNRYKDYMGVFPGPKFVSPEWRCPRGERFHYSFSLEYRSLISLVNFPLHE